MAIPSESDRFASFDKVKKSVTQFTDQFDLSYLLRKYLDKNYWVSELQKCFSVINVDNLTDFNYSRCFTYAINEADIDLYVGKKEFNEYVIEHGCLNRVHVMVSVLAPYVVYKSIRYGHRDGRVLMESSIGGGEWQRHVDVAVTEFCNRNNLSLIADGDLKRTVEGISLELHGPNPSVYNILFEDGRADFPY